MLRLKPGDEVLHSKLGPCEIKQITYADYEFFGVILKPKTKAGKEMLVRTFGKDVVSYVEDSLRMNKSRTGSKPLALRELQK